MKYCQKCWIEKEESCFFNSELCNACEEKKLRKNNNQKKQIKRERIKNGFYTPEKTTVYFIKPAKGNVVKIGKSRNPYERLKQLQTSHYERLYIAAIIPNTSPLVEKGLHGLFKNKHINGEWYSGKILNKEKIEDALNKIRANTSKVLLNDYGDTNFKIEFKEAI